MMRIFLSYRRADTSDAAARLHEALVRSLPEAVIFRDVASLAPGTDWMSEVVRSVQSADQVLVLIGDRWFERGRNGELRLDDRSDVVRLELETAITRGIPILPVTVDGAAMPPPASLPLAVARLGRLQRATLSTADVDADVARLTDALRSPAAGRRRSPVPAELVGFWSHATAQSGRSYEFSANGTYVGSGVVRQDRATGLFEMESFEEGIVDVEVGAAMVTHLQPLRASADRTDAGDPGGDYRDSPRELIDKTLTWRALVDPPRLVLHEPDDSETVFDLQWRPVDDSGPDPEPARRPRTAASVARCYVAMPFGTRTLNDGRTIDFDLVYEQAVRPAVEAVGYTALRPDNVVSTGTISRAVIQAVARAEVMVADLSAPSHYVSYELGMRHGLVPSGTLVLLAEGADRPANLLDVRTLGYRPPAGAGDPALVELRGRVVAALRPITGTEPVDSPFFRTFPDASRVLPDSAEDGQGRHEQDEALRARLLDARRTQPAEEGLSRLRELERDTAAADLDDDRMRMDLMLAYRDLAGWNDVIRLVASFPPPLAQSPTVVQQKALAFNRSGLTGGATRAERALRELLERIGPDSETYGLLGRIYKDRYQRTSSRADLDRAIDAYRQGWLIDHRDIYPGINLATLLTLAGDAGAAEEEARQVVAELREIVDPRIDDAPADYWDVATGVELAALGRDWVRAGQLVEAARVRAAAAWMIESTANNLQILREAMPDPRDRGKMDQLIRDLAPEAASS